MTKAVVTVSGGLDSTVVLGEALRKGRHVYPLFFDYGQPSLQREFRSAEHVVRHYRERLARIDVLHVITLRGIPSAREGYYHNRNSYLLSLGVGYSESLEISELWCGLVQGDSDVDVDFLRDATPEFLGKAQELFDEATQYYNVKVLAPFVQRTKTDVVRHAVKIGAPIGLTWSCSAELAVPCGTCPSCKERRIGFTKAGVEDGYVLTS